VTLRALLLLGLLAALPASAALARPAGPTAATRVSRSAVEARLRAYEPGSPSSWQTLGAGADEALVDVAADAKMDVLVRARAVAALGYFPTAPARRFLERTIESKAAAKDPGDRLLLRRAAVALGWMGGLGVPARLGPLLDHEDPEVRLDAAIALGLTRLAPAADLLRKRMDVEPVPRVRSQMGRQLRVIEDARAAAAAAR
jgi:HEAT repeat protein